MISTHKCHECDGSGQITIINAYSSAEETSICDYCIGTGKLTSTWKKFNSSLGDRTKYPLK